MLDITSVHLSVVSLVLLLTQERKDPESPKLTGKLLTGFVL